MRNSKCVLLMMLTVCMIVPFGNDIFLASMPQIQQVFAISNVSMMVSLYLFGLAIGQLFYGPLFDYFGRKPVLVVGLLIYLLGNVAVLSAANFELLLLGRFVSAIGACSAAVAAMTIVRDSFHGHDLTKYIAVVFGIIAVCPVLSPIVGSYLQLHFGWHGSFSLLILFATFYFLVTMLLFKETMQEKNQHALRLSHIFGNYASFFKHPIYMAYTIISCCSYAILFAYVSVASLLIMNRLGYGPHGFAIIFLLNTLIILMMNFTVPAFSRKTSLRLTASIGVILLVAGVGLFYVLTDVYGFKTWVLLLSAFVLLAGVGAIRPTAAAGAMHIFPKNVSGSASALFLFFCFIGGMISSAVSGYCVLQSLNAFYGVLAVFAIMALLTLMLLRSTTMPVINETGVEKPH